MSIVFLKNSLKCLNPARIVYKSIAVSADDNPHILSGDIAHGDVAILRKCTIDDFVTPFENIESEHIVGIRCDFDNFDPLFILSCPHLTVLLTNSRNTLISYGHSMIHGQTKDMC